MIIEYGINMTPFGSILIAKSEKGITDIEFTSSPLMSEAKLLARWNEAQIIRNDKKLAEITHKIFIENKTYPEIELDMIGTDFQVKVWQGLLIIKKGETSTYGEIAENIGHPGALRAVGSAVGKNPIQYVIPCHRVIKKDGGLGDYAAGIRLKKALLATELNKSVL